MGIRKFIVNNVLQTTKEQPHSPIRELGYSMYYDIIESYASACRDVSQLSLPPPLPPRRQPATVLRHCKWTNIQPARCVYAATPAPEGLLSSPRSPSFTEPHTNNASCSSGCSGDSGHWEQSDRRDCHNNTFLKCCDPPAAKREPDAELKKQCMLIDTLQNLEFGPSRSSQAKPHLTTSQIRSRRQAMSFNNALPSCPSTPRTRRSLLLPSLPNSKFSLSDATRVSGPGCSKEQINEAVSQIISAKPRAIQHESSFTCRSSVGSSGFSVDSDYTCVDSIDITKCHNRCE
ncbi:hypothetical protein EV182_006607 [Spiromyces aspiralis]|uniref:Uncharacterized protein n=1 Tax=Spiromyces aspiralis TaxID=68401 RepID=A0ACC1HBU3_9FUNG|nr:hypothetical protein EV182_006607 [Spiromyces aspiralis]